jgi:glutathionylspermidine synthase
MKRSIVPKRPNWQQTVEASGLFWHSAKGDYWNEGVFYEFTMDEILKIEDATNKLHGMCLKAVQHVIDKKLYDKFKIPTAAIPLIEASWEQEPPSLYGRFDFAYSGDGVPKMLEYNADTPTSLLEASVIQWQWMQEVFPNTDQFNSLHERIIEQWKYLAPYLQGKTLHFVSMDDIEDGVTVSYLADCATQAGITTKILTMDQIGMTEDGYFVDMDDEVIESCFKLYPWEWLINEEYAPQMFAIGTDMQWIEPAWKMILSNKAILAILWELFPDHPNLLPASFEESDTILWESYVKKPLLSREGANVTVTMFDQTLTASQGDYGEEGFIYQGMASIPEFDGFFPVIGSWIIGQEAAGMGIRESTRMITDNLSKFTPHIIRG